MTVTGITQTIPLAAADITIWGFPAERSHDDERFPNGSPGNPAGCPSEADAVCASQRRLEPAPVPPPAR